jgi:hypothetical protein
MIGIVAQMPITWYFNLQFHAQIHRSITVVRPLSWTPTVEMKREPITTGTAARFCVLIDAIDASILVEFYGSILD